MPMFDIEDSKNVTLTNNKTTDNTLLKGRNIDRVTASNNESGGAPKQSRWQWFLDNIIVAVVGGIAVATIIAYVAWQWPPLKPLLK